jgi:hypothetical protein
MTSWKTHELDEVAGSDELRIASRRADGSLRPGIIIWFVRSGDALYVRSAYGPENGWYRRARAAGQGRIQIGAWERDVTFDVPDESMDEELHQAFGAKYERYPPAIVGPVVSDEAARCTLRILPA